MEEAIGDRPVVPSVICLGIAGVDRPDDATIVRAIMKRIGYKAKVIVVNDALVALEAGAPRQPGVVIISGTGSISYGRNAEGEAARSGGWGYVLGDEGSGYWIGRSALRAVLREADKRGPKTVLTRMLLEHFGVGQAQGLIHEVYHTNLKPAAIGALARSVQRAYLEGDQAAVGILRAAANDSSPAPCPWPEGSDSSGRPSPSSCQEASFAPSPGSMEELTRRLPVVARGVDGALARPGTGTRRHRACAAGSDRRGHDPSIPDRLMPLRHRISILPDADEVARAPRGAHGGCARAKPSAVLGLPTGRTPLLLVRRVRAARSERGSGLFAGDHVQPGRVPRYSGVASRAAIAASCSATSSTM